MQISRERDTSEDSLDTKCVDKLQSLLISMMRKNETNEKKIEKYRRKSSTKWNTKIKFYKKLKMAKTMKAKLQQKN